MAGRVRCRTVRASIDDAEISESFAALLGGDDAQADLPVVWRKYRLIRRGGRRLARFLGLLGGSRTVALFPEVRAAVEAYTADVRAMLARDFAAPDLDRHRDPGKLRLAQALGQELDPDFDAAPAEEVAAFRLAWPGVKDCETVGLLLEACKVLIPHRQALAQQSDRFLRGAGYAFLPLAGLPELNYKALYHDPRLAPPGRAFLLAGLAKLHEVAHGLYKAVSLPDIDVERLIEVIMSALDEVRRYVPRCDEAFKHIADSVHLLRENFGGYHRDFMISNNPTIILENFVLDVSRQRAGSARLAGQFKRIILHYKRLAGDRQMDPRMRRLFSHVDTNLQELERLDGAAGEPEPPRPPPSEAARRRTDKRRLRRRRQRASKQRAQSGQAAE